MVSRAAEEKQPVSSCQAEQSRTQGVIIGNTETQMVQGRPVVSAAVLLAKP